MNRGKNHFYVVKEKKYRHRWEINQIIFCSTTTERIRPHTHLLHCTIYNSVFTPIIPIRVYYLQYYPDHTCKGIR